MPKFTLLSVRFLFTTLLLTIFTTIKAQIPASETRVVQPAKTETVAEIMQRQSLSPKAVYHERRELEGPDRKHLKQNPLAPAISSFPPKPEGERLNERQTSNIAQTPGTGFNGVTGPDETLAYPPDNMGAIGPTQYIVFVNGRLRSFNKTTGVADGVLNANPDVFFASVRTPVGGGVIQVFTSDPRIRYDRISARWILLIIDVPCANSGCSSYTANRCLIAVSNTSTITAGTTWTFTQFTGETGKFFDYPTLGLDVNGIYIGGNMFNLTGTAYLGTNGWVINRANVMAGAAYTVYTFSGLSGSSGAGPYTPQGVDNFDLSATEGYFIGTDNAAYSLLQVRRISTPAAVPTISANIPVTVPTTGQSVDVPNLGGAQALDAIDDRLYAAVIRNGRLWTAHAFSVNAAGVASTTQGREACRWYELQNMTTTPALVQSGTIFDNAPTAAAARWHWFPSVMVSGQGHSALGMTTAGSTFRVNATTGGRLSSDAPGTTQANTLVTASSTAYSVGNNRWGDYSYVSLDPLDDMTMWQINQYCVSTNKYGCNVTKLLAPQPATPASCSPASVASGQASVNVVLTGTSVSGTGFYDPGPNMAPPALPFNHIAAAVTGGVTVNSITYTSPTSITLNLNTTAASAGLQSITVTNPDGQTMASAGGILTITGVSGSTSDLAISKTDGVTTFTPGGTTTYTIIASNAGPNTSTGATVTDNFPASITSVAWTAVYAGGATGPANGSGNINASVNFPVGGTATFTAVCNISGAASGNLVNTATVTVPAGDTDPTPGNNSATDTDTQISADLSITKTDGVTTYTPGGSTTYTIVASNAGANNATGATVTDNFPAAITAVTWTAVYAGGASGPANGSGNINASVNLPVGGTATFTASCTISGAASGNLVNTATITLPAGYIDPTPANNSATDTDTQISADAAITKTDGVTTYTPGGSTTYTIIASNAGSNNITGGTVTDNFPAAITGVTWTAVYAGGATGPANGSGNINATVNLPVGGTATFTAVCTISGSASGNLVNTATIALPTGYIDPNPGNNSATDVDQTCTITLSSAPGSDAQTVCLNTPVNNITYNTAIATGATFSGLPTGVTGSWASNVVTISGTPTVTGVFNYTVTFIGCSTTSMGMITVTNPPSATIAYSGSPYCQNAGTAAVTRTGSAGGIYSSTSGLTLNAATGAVTLGTSTAGTYTVTYTIAASGGCSTFTTTTTIIITATPSATISYAGSPYCANAGSANVTQNGIAGGSYSSTSGLTLNAATGTVNLATSTPGTYTVTYTIAAGGGCPSFSTTTSITITALPAATISYTGNPYCSNAGSANVTQTGTAGGTYSSTAGLTINTATGTVALGTSTAGTYVVSYTIAGAGGCPTVIATTSITITLLPAATIAYSGSPYCSNSGIANVTRTGTAGGTYSSSAGLAINPTTGVVTLGSSTPGTYTVTYTIPSGGGCATFTTTTTVTVTALSAAAISYVGSPYCSNAGTATVTLTGTAGGTYNASPAGLVINAATGDVNSGTSTSGSYTVTYTIAAGSGCPAVTATTTITITTLPAATISYAGNPYCQNASTANVIRTGTAGGTYSALPAGLNINAATGAITFATSTPGTYTIIYTIAAGGGCGVVTATTSITVNSLSTDPTGTTASAISLCGPGAVTLNVTGGSLGTGATWRWYSGSCGGTLVGTGASLNLTANATTTYFVRAEGTCNTTTCASVTVTVNPQPTINIASSATSLQPGQTATLTATVTPATSNTIIWYRDGVLIPGANGLTLVIGVDGVMGTYTARATTVAGCTALSNSVIVTATPSERLWITPNPNNGQFKVRYYTKEVVFGFLRHLVIYSESGQLVYDKTFTITASYSSMDIDSRHFSKGVYVVMLTDAFGKEVLATGKVVIQ